MFLQWRFKGSLVSRVLCWHSSFLKSWRFSFTFFSGNRHCWMHERRFIRNNFCQMHERPEAFLCYIFFHLPLARFQISKIAIEFLILAEVCNFNVAFFAYKKNYAFWEQFHVVSKQTFWLANSCWDLHHLNNCVDLKSLLIIIYHCTTNTDLNNTNNVFSLLAI